VQSLQGVTGLQHRGMFGDRGDHVWSVGLASEHDAAQGEVVGL
jgi:hypothetical protein